MKIVWKTVVAAFVLTAGFAAASVAETRDEAWARERCTKDGYKPNTAEMDGCIRYTVAWLEKSRRDAQRNFQ
jgi:hypothetical protein